jgi:hypothetical protein
MFRPFYNGHLQASILGGAVNTIVIRILYTHRYIYILVIVYEHNGNAFLEYKGCIIHRANSRAGR